MEAFCMKCKTKREIVDPVAMFNSAGAPVTRGTCGVCGTTLYRIGKTDAHAGMEKPKKVNKRSGKLVIVEFSSQGEDRGSFSWQGLHGTRLSWARS